MELPNEKLEQLARDVAQIDACFTAATISRGVDGNGVRIPGLQTRIDQALDKLMLAGIAAHKLRKQTR